MSVLMEQRVNWSAWASNAATLTCPACKRDFQPNHPRRRYCGAEDCPGRTRRRATSAPRPRPARTPRRTRRRLRIETNQLAGLLAEVSLELHRAEFTGTTREVAQACADLIRTLAAKPSPLAERAGTVRVLAAATARAAALNPPGAS